RDLFGSPSALDFSSRVLRYGCQHRGPVDRTAGIYSLGLVENGTRIDRIPKRILEIHILSLEILGIRQILTLGFLKSSLLAHPLRIPWRDVPFAASYRGSSPLR